MAAVTSVSLSVSGTINGESVSASGSLVVDETAGTKSGDITVNQPPGSSTCPPDGYAMPMPKCFVGARSIRPEVVNPIRLLGTHFVSLRVTYLGPFGHLSQVEHASLRKGTLTSHQVVFGEVRHKRVEKVTGIQEVIQVAGPAHLSAEGSYTLVIDSKAKPPVTIPVTYRHFYRSLTPNARLFRAHKKKKFLLVAEVQPRHRGQVVSVRTKSTIEYV